MPTLRSPIEGAVVGESSEVMLDDHASHVVMAGMPRFGRGRARAAPPFDAFSKRPWESAAALQHGLGTRRKVRGRLLLRAFDLGEVRPVIAHLPRQCCL